MTVTTHAHVGLTVDSQDRYRWITLASIGLLAVAAGMAALGLPQFDLHGPLHWFGIMDPLCGGTRAARYTALGEWDLAWKYNPLGIVTVIAVGLLALRAGVGVLTRHWITLDITWTRRGRWVAVTIAALLVIALEIRQQGRAELLMAGTFTLV
ncbi:hypothetical protein ASE01_20415 [Nocardioides sp. Root190]|uniref:DUF2752 domain-containing protein n=1 Tax=Nocardioides sp. Root190 TaxID=1736488 RepID=UPI0006FBC007|nr:DUF2752 domain-containing protein [Nocardioides sp. Root190]KRB73137.1 hypothetical protein ASE01_20415 [Nocardioides sp. Root190]